jgi:glycine cleavage system regulatory protein
MASLTLTLIGRDRPGLVDALALRIADAGGSWQESRMARLAGQFAGILLVEMPEAAVDGLIGSLRALDAEGLHVTAERGGGDPPAPQHTLNLELVGHDRPGIVREIAHALAGRGVNIEELETEVTTGSFSGEALFRATARLSAPVELATHELRATLETIANELMVDVELDEATG